MRMRHRSHHFAIQLSLMMQIEQGSKPKAASIELSLDTQCARPSLARLATLRSRDRSTCQKYSNVQLELSSAVHNPGTAGRLTSLHCLHCSPTYDIDVDAASFLPTFKRCTADSDGNDGNVITTTDAILCATINSLPTPQSCSCPRDFLRSTRRLRNKVGDS